MNHSILRNSILSFQIPIYITVTPCRCSSYSCNKLVFTSTTKLLPFVQLQHSGITPAAHHLLPPTDFQAAMADQPSANREAIFLRPLSIYFIPFPTPGHIIPMLDIARIFAGRGASTTVVLTPLNAARFGNDAYNHIHVLPFPATEAGLPDCCESADTLPSRYLGAQFARAVDLLQGPFDRFVRDQPPDAIVSDSLLPWTAMAAEAAGVPRYVFPGTGCFALSVERSLRQNQPEKSAVSDSKWFLVPGIPDRVYLTRTRLAEATTPGAATKQFLDRTWGPSGSAVAGFVVNTFRELEPHYIEHYERETGTRVFAVGPVSLADRPEPDEVAARVTQWLDSKPAQSVIYVCFGSLGRFSAAQLREIALGLEESRVSFLWVVGDAAATAEEVMEAAVERRVGARGMVVREWAAQVAALRHPAVGGFLTHCGWGSVTEAAAAGVPVLTWPLFAEQFYNESLVVALGQWGLPVGAKAGFAWGEEERIGVMVGRRKIAERVAQLIDGQDEEVARIRGRARYMAELAREAVAKRGSSYVAVIEMMQDAIRRRQQERRE